MLTNPNFSLYGLIDWQNVQSIFSEERGLLSHWCKAMEEAVVEEQLAANVVAGFQSIKRIKPILERYQKITTVANSVTVFGLPGKVITEADLTGMNYITLAPGDALVREWFLVVNHPNYTRALVAHEIDGESGKFHGAITSDAAHIRQFYEALNDVIQIKT